MAAGRMKQCSVVTDAAGINVKVDAASVQPLGEKKKSPVYSAFI